MEILITITIIVAILAGFMCVIGWAFQHDLKKWKRHILNIENT